MMRSIQAMLATTIAIAGCAASPNIQSTEEASIAAEPQVPELAWPFQNMDQIFPIAIVDRGTMPVDDLATSEIDLSQITFTNTAGETAGLEDLLSGSEVDALVIVHDGDVIFEHYAHGQTQETRHIVYSVTKSFTALLAELLINDGVLDESAPLSTYVPELIGSAYGDATLRQALNMQVGADFSEDYDDPNSSIAQFARAAGISPRADGETGPDSLHDYLPTIAKKGEHGGPFHYNTATTEVVGWVIERAAEKTVPELLSERIFSKIGAEHDAYFLAADTNQTAMAGGGLNITARDLARLGLLILRDGRGPSGDIVIPKATIEAIRSADLSLGDWAVPGGTSTYRSFWYVNKPDRITTAYGIHGQALYVSPNGKLVAVMQSSNELAEGDFFVDFEFLSNAISNHFDD